MSRENVELTRRAFQAFNDRELDAVLAGLHVEILEVRDLGEFIVLALRLRGRDGKVIRWRVYTSESEALATVGLRE